MQITELSAKLKILYDKNTILPQKKHWKNRQQTPAATIFPSNSPHMLHLQENLLATAKNIFHTYNQNIATERQC